MWRASLFNGFAMLLVAAAAHAFEPQSDVAISLTPEEFELYRLPDIQLQDAPIGGFSVAATDRLDVVTFYHCTYLASEGWESRMGWTGDVANCIAGTVSNAFHEDCLRRVNYYRAMAGLPANITFDPGKNADCQQAALMMSKNRALSHNPSNSWFCFTAAGSNAATRGNLHIGFTGPAGLDSLMEDEGDHNAPVGHRRWILYSAQTEMGGGGVPATPGYMASYVLWVIGDFGPHAPVPFIAWPPAGYVPYSLVFPRWSFALTNANALTFSNATIHMTRNGSPMTAVKIHPTPASPAGGYGNYALVWEPQGLPGGVTATDDVYVVTFSNLLGLAQSSMTYTVRVTDPDRLGHAAGISGPTNPILGASNPYTFTPVPRVAAYDLRIRKAVATNWLEGAETSPPPRIVDGTSPSYPLIQSDVKLTGARAFHLAFPGFTSQWFEVDRTLLPGTNTLLRFAYLRRFSSTSNVMRAEISANDGLSWTNIWMARGICISGGMCGSESWDPAFIITNANLAAYAGVPIRVRFRFDHMNTIFSGTNSNYGVFFDDISVTNAMQFTSESVSSLASNATGFTFQPDATARYLMDIRPTISCKTFGYGPLFVATSVAGSSPMITLRSMTVNATQVVVGFTVAGTPPPSYTLRRRFGDLNSTNWPGDVGAVFDAGQMRFTTPRPQSNAVFYRVEGPP